MANQSRSSNHAFVGTFLVGLGLIGIFDYWWPGIMFVVAAAILVSSILEGRLGHDILSVAILTGIGIIRRDRANRHGKSPRVGNPLHRGGRGLPGENVLEAEVAYSSGSAGGLVSSICGTRFLLNVFQPGRSLRNNFRVSVIGVSSMK